MDEQDIATNFAEWLKKNELIFIDPDDPQKKRRFVRPPIAARLIGSTTQGLAYLRHVGRGPMHYRVGSKIYYEVSELQQFIEAGRVVPANAQGAA